MPMMMSGFAARSIIFLQLGAPMAVTMTMSFLPMLVFTVASLLIPILQILTGSFEQKSSSDRIIHQGFVRSLLLLLDCE